MKNIVWLIFFLLVNTVLYAQVVPVTTQTKLFTIGETVSFYSEILEEERILNIYLPNAYHPDSVKIYPVIYLLDGSIDEDIIHIAGLVQFCSFPWIGIMQETIVVGIANVDRKRDLTFPTSIATDKEQFPTTGGSAAFIEFLEKEVKIMVEEKYETDTISTIIGQSLGGLLATEVLFRKPKVFTNYIIISPSLWWNNQSLLALTPDEFSGVKNIYVGVGKEGRGMVKPAKKLYKKVKKLLDGKSNIYHQYFPDQDHGDVLHVAVYDALIKIFDSSK